VLHFAHLSACSRSRRSLRLYRLVGHRLSWGFLGLALATFHVCFKRSALLVSEGVEVEFENNFVLVFTALLHDGHNALELLSGEVFNSKSELLALRIGHGLSAARTGFGLGDFLGVEGGFLLERRVIRVHALVLLELQGDLVEVAVDPVDGVDKVGVVNVGTEEVKDLLAVFEETEERGVLALAEASVDFVEVHWVALE